MEHFYDGQIRRYITQVIRVFSNFVVKYGDGTLVRIPVMYGNADRQAASIIRQNSENKVNSVPRIAVYVSALALDRDRLSDSSYISKVNIRERDVANDTYTTGQGRNYTIERLMPTPFKLTLKVDIWSANTEQKLQIMEQILVLFNPSLEIQTSDNYIDWTSLSVLNLNDISWSSQTVPIGAETPIEVGTLTLDTPIWISPPVKVKHLGVVTKIVASVAGNATTSGTYIDGLGTDPMGSTSVTSGSLFDLSATIDDYRIEVYGSTVILLSASESVIPREPTLDMPVRQGTPINWDTVFSTSGGRYIAGSSMIFLAQPNGSYVVGTVAISALDQTVLSVNWNGDTLTTNTGIDSNGILEGSNKFIAGTGSINYNANTSYRPNSPGTFDAIVNPLTYNPYRPLGTEITDQPIVVGKRFLIIEDIGDTTNVTPAQAWGALVAKANNIIEWTGTAWHIIFDHSQYPDTMVWQTNIYTGVQYAWNGVSWVKSFEGIYEAKQWKIVL
jgi:hypothetical protein